MSSLKSLWGKLGSTPFLRPGLSAIRIYPEAKVELFAALDRPNDIPLVFVNLASTKISSNLQFPSSAGFEICREASDRGPNHIRIALRLLNKAYEDIFVTLAQDIVERLSKANSDGEAVAILIERLRRWQDFLNRFGLSGLDEARQRGLFGELWFLRQYGLPNAGPSIAVGAWTGPEATNHDFQFRGCNVEVKTTTANRPHLLHISNARQLDNTELAALILAHIALEPRRGSGETLVDMVTSIRSLLAQESLPLSLFEEKLVESGYLDTHASRYVEAGYLVRAHDFFRVTDTFPRLTESSLPSGVVDVTYSIALAACTPFSIGTEKLLELLPS